MNIGCFALVAALGLIAAGCCAPPSSSSSSSTKPPPAATKHPALEVTSNQLFNDYHANEVSADAKYKGKTIAVTGAVTSIDKDLFDNIVVHLSTPNQFMGIMAKLDDSQKGMAANLSKGQSLRLVCEVQGLIVGSPSLTDCSK